MFVNAEVALDGGGTDFGTPVPPPQLSQLTARFGVPDQASYRAYGYFELLSNLRRMFAGLGPVPNGLSNSRRKSAWHHRILSFESAKQRSMIRGMLTPGSIVDKLCVAIMDKLLSGLSDKLYVG
jgi:hypothetical protein